jgi:single-strand DNA-binding protein
MDDINVINLSGRVVNNPTLKYNKANTPILAFRIAVNRSVKRNDNWENEASFVNCMMIKKVAEYIYKEINKGDKVFLQGSLSIRNTKDDNGNYKSYTNVFVNNLQLTNYKKNENNSSSDTNETPEYDESDEPLYPDDEDLPV